ncbi:MAG: hypothetical protein NVS4B3_03370 [Gemmatimonadaceae bacterium]
MSIRRLPAIFALIGISCSTAPSAPPFGLPVAVSWVPYSPTASTVPPAAITAAADSVVIVGGLLINGCANYTGQAGGFGGRLVVTVTEKGPNPVCSYFNPRLTLRAVVHAVPAGSYETVVDHTFIPYAGAPSTTELARTSITLP